MFKDASHRRRAGFMRRHITLLQAYFRDFNPSAHAVRKFLMTDDNNKVFVNDEGKPFTVKQIVDKVRSFKTSCKLT